MDALGRSTGTEAAVDSIEVLRDGGVIAARKGTLRSHQGERLNNVAYFRATVLAAKSLAEFTRTRGSACTSLPWDALA